MAGRRLGAVEAYVPGVFAVREEDGGGEVQGEV